MALKTGDVTADWNTIAEPESAANTYFRPTDNNIVAATDSGHTFEMDDTNGRERIRINHRSGTFIEMHPNGTEVHKIYGEGYEIVLSNKKVKIFGNSVISVDKDAAIQVKGNATIKAGKNLSIQAENNIDMTSLNGTINLNGSEVNVNAKKGLAFTGTNTSIPGNLNVAGDLTVQQSISALQNVSASGAMWAVAGFATSGSLFVGIPSLAAAIPVMMTNTVVIDCLACSVTSKTLINAMAGAGITVKAGALCSISAGGGIGIASGAYIGVTAVGKVNVAAVASLSLDGAVVDIKGAKIGLISPAVTTTGLLTVAGIVTAADYFCIANPSFYSVHIHATAVGPTSPPK